MSMSKTKSGLILGVIILMNLPGVMGFEDSRISQLQWTEGVSGRLQLGEVLTYKGYSVEIIAFPAPVESARYKPEPEEPVEAFVGLNISKDGKFISTVVLGLADSYILPDGELKVTAKELPAKNAREWLFESYAPWAVIELNPRGVPRIGVSIQTDKPRYVSSYATDIIVTVTLENTGSADAVNVDTVIETELQVKRGSLKYHYERVKKGESITETLTLPSPILAEQKTYVISANVTGYDVRDMQYNAKSSKSFSIGAEPQVSLSIRKTTVDRMYLKDYTIISLSVKNNGRFDAKNVNIADNLPDSFKLLGNQSLHWTVDIPAGGEWGYRYLVRPQEASKEGIVLPAATAEFTANGEFYIVQSNLPRIVVHGPRLVLTKQTDISEVNPGGTVTVTIVAENAGSTPTRMSIIDTLPDGVTLIRGGTTYDTFLEATRKVSFSYTLRIDSRPPVTLPAANAEYFELGSKGRRISTASNEVEIQIKSLKKTPAPTITATPTPVQTPQITTAIPTVLTPAPTPRITPTPPPAVTPVTKIPDGLIRQIVFNTLLGCNDTNISRFNATLVACRFFEQGIEVPVNVSVKKSTVDTMLLKDFASILLSVRNNGSYDLKNVLIKDSLPESFRLLGDQSLHLVADIPANSEWEYRYLVRPQEPSKNGITLPSAVAEFTLMNRLYTLRSNQPRIVVLGSKVVLTKIVDVSEVKPGGDVTVTIVAENTGTAPTSIVIADNVPEGASLVSGSTAFEGVLEAENKASFSYKIKINKPVTLPAATAEYYEYASRGRKLSIKSQEIEIKIK